jgi:hypothetical protein
VHQGLKPKIDEKGEQYVLLVHAIEGDLPASRIQLPKEVEDLRPSSSAPNKPRVLDLCMVTHVEARIEEALSLTVANCSTRQDEHRLLAIDEVGTCVPSLIKEDIDDRHFSFSDSIPQIGRLIGGIGDFAVESDSRPFLSMRQRDSFSRNSSLQLA